MMEYVIPKVNNLGTPLPCCTCSGVPSYIHYEQSVHTTSDTHQHGIDVHTPTSDTHQQVSRWARCTWCPDVSLHSRGCTDMMSGEHQSVLWRAEMGTSSGTHQCNKEW